MSLMQAVADAMSVGNTPEAHVDEFYRLLEQPDFAWGQPDAVEFDFVLDKFASWVAAEAKSDMALAAVRASTIRYIKENITSRPTYAFPGIEPTVSGIQLAMRVRRPRAIDQGDTGLCGAVSVLYSFAKSRPQEFAQFALDLFFKGRALFGTLDIEPSPEVRRNYVMRRMQIPWAVDYVLLVSLRQCTFFADKIHIGGLRGADETTLPGQLGAWLREAGYRNVQDHTFFGRNQTKVVKAFAASIGQAMHLPNATGDRAARVDRLDHAEKNLNAARQALNGGNIVIVFGAGELSHALEGGYSANLAARNGPTKLGKHHWVAARKIFVMGDTVVFKAVTWGKVYQGRYDLQAFLSYYNGYVTAQP